MGIGHALKLVILVRRQAQAVVVGRYSRSSWLVGVVERSFSAILILNTLFYKLFCLSAEGNPQSLTSRIRAKGWFLGGFCF